MKVGDLVRMTFSVKEGDIWGPGIVLGIALDPQGGSHNIEIWWSKMGIGWEMAEMVEVISECR